MNVLQLLNLGSSYYRKVAVERVLYVEGFRSNQSGTSQGNPCFPVCSRVFMSSNLRLNTRNITKMARGRKNEKHGEL